MGPAIAARFGSPTAVNATYVDAGAEGTHVLRVCPKRLYRT